MKATKLNVAFGVSSVVLLGSLVAYPLFKQEAIALESPAQTFGIPRANGNSKQSITMMTPLQVSSKLRELEESYLVERGQGVLRYDVAQLPSNSPIEDDRSERIVQVPLITPDDKRNSTDWMFWGVYDGHGGWTTSAKLRDELIHSVLTELDKSYVKSSSDSVYRLIPSPEIINNAIEKGFVKLDDEIVYRSVERLLANPTKAGAAELIAPALSGSCGLLAFYDTHSKDLRVAVTGDSRAVLGTRGADGEWSACALSTDQTGSNEEEAARLRAEHPGEESTVVRRGRVLGGLEPTRAFGDARYKWTKDFQERIQKSFFGRRSPQELKTPPYVTARPVITTTKIKPENGDFLVMATDGLFEMLSNEEIVGLVVEWMQAKQPQYLTVPVKEKSDSLWTKVFGGKKGGESGTNVTADNGGLTVTVRDTSLNREAQKQPIRRRQGAPPPHFTVEDENVSTHLIRNALGGGDIEQVSMLASIPSPISRNYRDDLTVTVVFFGNSLQGEDGGSVRVNDLATRNNLKNPVKSKL
jgi:pyruvate dehydrogenase phosphatase